MKQDLDSQDSFIKINKNMDITNHLILFSLYYKIHIMRDESFISNTDKQKE